MELNNHDLSNKKLHISYKEYVNKYLDLSVAEKDIINILKENPNITIEECSVDLKKSVRTTKEHFKKLKENYRKSWV